MPASDSVGNPNPSDGRPDLDSPSVWTELIESVGPGSLLLIIESRLSTALKQRLAPEDILQDALLHAWRDRGQCEWRGLRSFRSWLLTIIDNRIRAAADHIGAVKRGGDRSTLTLSGKDLSDGPPCDPWFSTTPSRLAVYREQAATMAEALMSLPPDLAAIVRMRLVEQLPVAEIAARMQIGEAAVRHRVRKGAELYRRKLRVLFGSKSGPGPSESESR